MVKYINCNSCGSQETKVLIPMAISNVVQCKKCGLVYKNPQLLGDKLPKMI